MHSIAKILRFIRSQIHGVCIFIRIIKLRLLYPGITIDLKTKIQKNCSIVCVDGGKLVINNSFIGCGTHIMADEASTIIITNTFISRNCVITSKESITIEGSHVAEMVVIRDQDHDKKNFKKFITAPVHIAENAWIASKATILKGVTIGKNAVVGAGAVVTNNIPENEVWCGVPAKHLK